MMDDIKYIHYSADRIIVVRSAKQKTELYMKPNGLWFSVEDGNGWQGWCQDNSWNLDCFKFHHLLKLKKDADICRIQNTNQFDFFANSYKEYPPWDIGHMIAMFINWARVAEKYQGIIIAPYLYDRRLESNSSWYYGWDCSSGCVWDTDAVESISVIEGGFVSNDR